MGPPAFTVPGTVQVPARAGTDHAKSALAATSGIEIRIVVTALTARRSR